VVENVTSVPGQIPVDGFALMLMLGVNDVEAESVMALLVAGLPVTQFKLEVMVQVITSLFAMLEVV
jgi:hypothetical protein